MPTSSSSKKNKPSHSTCVRKRDHPKIRAVVEKLLKDSNDPDLLHPSKVGLLTLKVARELAPEHKWYKPMLEMPEPVMDKLYRSLFDHLYTTWIAEDLSNPTEHESD